MKIKTSELTGAALDWAVAKALGNTVRIEQFQGRVRVLLAGQRRSAYNGGFQPSTDWAQGGPIIEREYIWLEINEGQCYAHKDGLRYQEGETPLVAAMRCLVAAKLGDEVEVPDELA